MLDIDYDFDTYDDDNLAAYATDELEQARDDICAAYAQFYSELKRQTHQLAIPDKDRRWINPDENGLEDILTNVCHVIDTAIDQAWREQ